MTRATSVLVTMATGLGQLAAVCFFLVRGFWALAWGFLMVLAAGMIFISNII